MYKSVHNLARIDELQIYSYRAVARSPYQTADLDRAVSRRLGSGRPVIVDGVLVLDALDQIGREADFLVWVDGGGEGRLAPQIAAYRLRQKRTADFTIEGYTD